MDKIDQIILEELESNKISGEKLSKKLGISRVAVWKRIKKLEKLGYKISHSQDGYRLLEKSPFLLPYEVSKILKTEKIGKNYIFFEEITSTNSFGKSEDLPDGTVVLAEYQTKGRGRKGRTWISSKGKGLYFSIILKSDYPIKDLLKLSLLFPYSVKKALEKFVKSKIKIKWPNDLYINNKKFAGFLIETEIEGSEIQKITAGIGININNEKEELKGLEETATSLKIEEGKYFQRVDIFVEILKEIENSLKMFNKIDLTDEIQKDLLWIGEYVFIVDEKIEGKLIGLDSSGGLKLLTKKGLKILLTGDVTVIKQNLNFE
ncbi:biotin--[acetyl-CoA-carboxylase] ligase [Persephonella sp.]